MLHGASILDTDELPACLHMLGTLRATGRPFRWRLLCLSDPPALALAALAPADVAVIRLGLLEDRFPALARAAAGRAPAARRALLAPFLAAYCLDADPTIARITLLPPAVEFHGDPQEALERFDDAAVGGAADPDGGVDWLSYPASPAGRRCLDAHQAAALAGAAIDPGDVRPPAHAGAHVTARRLATDALAERDGRLWCRETPVLWFRFSGLRVTELLTYQADPPQGPSAALALRRLYRPYFTRLVEQARALRSRFPELTLAPPAAPPVPPTDAEWAVQPEGWRAEPGVDGWSDEIVNQFRLHRLLDVMARTAGAAPLDSAAWRYCIIHDFAHAVARAAQNHTPVSVLDWGGGLGDYRLYLRALWPELALDYHVRDLAAVCDYGRAAMADVTFHDDDSSAFARDYDVVFAASALQYAADWQGALGRLVRAARQFVMLTRVPMVAHHPSFVVRQRPQLYGGASSYQSWVFNQQKLLNAIGALPVALVRETLVDERASVPDAPEQPISRGLLLARTGLG